MKRAIVLAMLVATPFLFGADGRLAQASNRAEIECEFKGFTKGTKEFEICVLDESLSAPTGR